MLKLDGWTGRVRTSYRDIATQLNKIHTRVYPKPYTSNLEAHLCELGRLLRVIVGKPLLLHTVHALDLKRLSAHRSSPMFER